MINNHTDANKLKGYSHSENKFGFCKTFRKVTKNLGFHLTFKTNELQNIMYSSMTDDKKVTINNLYLYVQNLIPNVETQVMLNESAQNKYQISFDGWYTERRVISDTITQLDIGTSQHASSPKHLIGAH